MNRTRYGVYNGARMKPDNSMVAAPGSPVLPVFRNVLAQSHWSSP